MIAKRLADARAHAVHDRRTSYTTGDDVEEVLAFDEIENRAIPLLGWRRDDNFSLFGLIGILSGIATVLASFGG
jgi:hypothetical protein